VIRDECVSGTQMVVAIFRSTSIVLHKLTNFFGNNSTSAKSGSLLGLNNYCKGCFRNSSFSNSTQPVSR
jgi:hypothetical protein